MKHTAATYFFLAALILLAALPKFAAASECQCSEFPNAGRWLTCNTAPEYCYSGTTCTDDSATTIAAADGYRYYSCSGGCGNAKRDLVGKCEYDTAFGYWVQDGCYYLCKNPTTSDTGADYDPDWTGTMWKGPYAYFDYSQDCACGGVGCPTPTPAPACSEPNLVFGTDPSPVTSSSSFTGRVGGDSVATAHIELWTEVGRGSV